MRTLTPALLKVLSAPGYAVHTRVLVDDGASNWRDLTALAGYNFLEEVTLTEGVDQAVATAEVRVRREVHQLSVAGMMTASKLNRLTGAYLPLLDIGRRIRVETATVARDAAPGAGDWTQAFDGEIDDVDPGTSSMTLVCRDLGARLQDRFIELERFYGINTSVGVPLWRPQRAVTVGQRIGPTHPSSVQYRTCTVAGTTGATEPLWNNGGTTADGTAVWSAPVSGSAAGGPVQAQMQAIIDDAFGGGAIALQTPSSPAWNIRKYLQRREPVLEALRTLAQQIGWDVRYRWSNATSDFRLTFWTPDRAKVVPDNAAHPFTASQYLDIRQLRTSRVGIRNVVRVLYWDPAFPDAEGKPTLREVLVEDAASIAKYGRRYMEVQEAASSRIDTQTEALRMAQAILSDLANPLAEQQVELPYWFAAELGDLYRFAANGTHYDSDQDFAVVGIRHTLARDECRTTLTCRGRPSTAYVRWLEMDARPGLGAPGQDSPPHSAADVAAVAGINGMSVKFKRPRTRFKSAELHVSTVAGFAPSDATLAAAGETARFDVQGLPPGTPQYARVLIRDELGNVSMSEQVTVTPRYVDGADVNPVLKYGFSASRAGSVGVETGADKALSDLLPLESWDYGGGYSAGLFTVPAGAAGRYRFRAWVTLTGAFPGDSGLLYLRKNGVGAAVLGASRLASVDPVSQATVLSLELDSTLDLAVGETIRLMLTTHSPRGASSYTVVGARTGFQAERLLTG